MNYITRVGISSSWASSSSRVSPKLNIQQNTKSLHHPLNFHPRMKKLLLNILFFLFRTNPTYWRIFVSLFWALQLCKQFKSLSYKDTFDIRKCYIRLSWNNGWNLILVWELQKVKNLGLALYAFGFDHDHRVCMLCCWWILLKSYRIC